MPYGAFPTKTSFPPERLAMLLAAAMAGTTVLTAGIVLAARRVSVGFDPPPGPLALLGVAMAGAGLVLLCDLAARACGSAVGGLRGWRLAARAGLAIGLAALLIPPPLTTLADVAACLLSAAIALAAALLPRLEPRSRPSASRRPPPRETAMPAGPVAELTARPFSAVGQGPIEKPAIEQVATASPGQILQRFERFLLDGEDCLRGRLSILVPQGARSGHGHVAFCPPFGRMPTVDVNTDYDGVEAVVTAAEIVPWGVRVECRLDDPAEEPFEIPVDLLARAPA
jgi:hypothetical protein